MASAPEPTIPPETPVTIEVDQIIFSKRKTLSLIVKPDGSLVVRAPLRTTRKSIREFVEMNRLWIERHQAKARATAPGAPKQFMPGEIFLYLGMPYPLELVRGQTNDLLLVETFKLAESAHRDAVSVFECWYRDQARRVLHERVEAYAREYGFQYKRLGITSARTRWGSCSTVGSLNFSWRLIQAPLEVVDYVVVHELVHTVFHDHSKQFWQRVEMILPDYRQHRDWLRKNGRELLG